MRSGRRDSRDRIVLGYAIAVALVAAFAILGLPLRERTHAAAPFLFFYPAIGLAAFFGGIGPGAAAATATAMIPVVFFSEIPAVFNWIWLSVVAPILVFGFAQLGKIRDRSAALAEESIELRFFVDRASDWIFLADEAGVVEYANQTACAQLGFSANHLKGRQLEEFTPESQRVSLRRMLAECRDDATAPTEILFERQDRTLVSVEIGCTGILRGDTRVIHVAGRDITERKAIDRKLREARHWEGLGTLAGGVAHDFNNLLASIMGNASLARNIVPDNHPITGLLDSIEIASERSAELVQMMLASSGYRPRFRRHVQVDETLRKLLEDRSIPSNVRVKANADAIALESDEQSVATLLWALIANAVESYGERSGEVLVSVRFVEGADTAQTVQPADASFEEGETGPGPSAVIVVEDRGGGMTPEILDRAFDPFFTTKFTGRGLGLPAVRGIVRAHDGKLRIRSRPDAGTRVEVWMPCASYHVGASM